MELKNRFLEAIQTEMQSQTIAEINREVLAAESCTAIAEEARDEFAVDFAHWCNTYDRNYPTHKYSYSKLLEIFKQNT